jgi:hypothetical protein
MLSEADRRLVAAWAADCAERVLGLSEAEAPADDRPRAAIARTRAFARGELNTAEEICRRFVGGVSAGEVKDPAAAAAGRAARQAVATCHMGAHALGAAAYAVKAASLVAPDRPEVVDNEIPRQLTHMTADKTSIGYASQEGRGPPSTSILTPPSPLQVRLPEDRLPHTNRESNSTPVQTGPPPGGRRGRQGIGADLGAQGIGDRPAQQPATVGVEHAAEIQPSSVGNVGHVPDPQLPPPALLRHLELPSKGLQTGLRCPYGGMPNTP